MQVLSKVFMFNHIKRSDQVTQSSSGPLNLKGCDIALLMKAILCQRCLSQEVREVSEHSIGDNTGHVYVKKK